MSREVHEVGESFKIQYVWRIESGHFLRALFRARVLGHDDSTDKYILLLEEFVAGKQEDAVGETANADELAREHWKTISELVGKKITLAYEADDGRTIRLKLATLTGEHNYFTRLNDPEFLERARKRLLELGRK